MILSFVLLALVFLACELICQFWVARGHIFGRWGSLIAYNKTLFFNQRHKVEVGWLTRLERATS